MRQCQKCQKPPKCPFGTFSTPLVSVFGDIRALLWEGRGECPGAVPVLVCRDEVVVECDIEQAANAKAWLEKAMIEGMDAALNNVGEAHVPVEAESQVADSWG